MRVLLPLWLCSVPGTARLLKGELTIACKCEGEQVPDPANYLKPGTYTRHSCAERHVFTPGGPLRVLRGQAGLEQALDLSENVLDQAKMDVGNSV